MNDKKRRRPKVGRKMIGRDKFYEREWKALRERFFF
jgi:hypothetical protein